MRNRRMPMSLSKALSVTSFAAVAALLAPPVAAYAADPTLSSTDTVGYAVGCRGVGSFGAVTYAHVVLRGNNGESGGSGSGTPGGSFGAGGLVTVDVTRAALDAGLYLSVGYNGDDAPQSHATPKVAGIGGYGGSNGGSGGDATELRVGGCNGTLIAVAAGGGGGGGGAFGDRGGNAGNADGSGTPGTYFGESQGGAAYNCATGPYTTYYPCPLTQPYGLAGGNGSAAGGGGGGGYTGGDGGNAGSGDASGGGGAGGVSFISADRRYVLSANPATNAPPSRGVDAGGGSGTVTQYSYGSVWQPIAAPYSPTGTATTTIAHILNGPGGPSAAAFGCTVVDMPYSSVSTTNIIQVTPTFTAETNGYAVAIDTSRFSQRATYSITVHPCRSAGNDGSDELFNGAVYTSSFQRVDTTPPVLTYPRSGISAEQTSPAGANVSFALNDDGEAPAQYYPVHALDAVDGYVNVTCDHQPGELYPPGTTNVTCSATDSEHNSVTGRFFISVADHQPPVISAVSNISADATGQTTSVSYTAPTANDAVEGPTSVTCSPASPVAAPVGTTTVTCTSADSNARTATKTFNIVVTDRPPVLTVPTAVNATATNSSGGSVPFDVSANDAVDGPRPVTCTTPSGTVTSGANFPIGHTVVTCTASDTANHQSTASFPIDVRFTDVPAGAPFEADITWLVSNKITGGYSDGTFRPVNDVSRQAFAAFLYRYAHNGADAGPCAPGSSNYADVSDDSAFCGDIQWLAAQHITGGFPDGGFHPTATVTRQATAAFLYRYNHNGTDAGRCAPGTSSFTDVPDDNPFCGDVKWLASQTPAIATGYSDGTFRPTAAVKRQAMAAFLHRYDTAFPRA